MKRSTGVASNGEGYCLRGANHVSGESPSREEGMGDGMPSAVIKRGWKTELAMEVQFAGKIIELNSGFSIVMFDKGKLMD